MIPLYIKEHGFSRIKIRYAEEGGKEKDGVVEIRRGVEDLSLGESHYAQVRILVDGKKYIKGMAVYSDDMPDGVDIVFNTNKSKDVPKMDVLKNISNDPDNPFGSLIKAGGQSYYIDKDGKRQLSLINKRAEEGDWGEWKDGLPSQFLSKQSITLLKTVKFSSCDKQAEFDEICSLTNPTVRKRYSNLLLMIVMQQPFIFKQQPYTAEYHVILPITSMKDNEFTLLIMRTENKWLLFVILMAALSKFQF